MGVDGTSDELLIMIVEIIGILDEVCSNGTTGAFVGFSDIAGLVVMKDGAATGSVAVMGKAKGVLEGG